MALHTEIPLYLRTVELIKMIYKITHHVPREYKYSLMQDIRRDAMNLTRCIYRANVSQDKRPHLAQLVDEFEFLKLELRLCNDLKIIDTGNYSRLILMMEDIGRQITGWRKSASSKRD